MAELRDDIENIRTTFNALMSLKKRYAKKELNDVQFVIQICKVIDDGHEEAMKLGKKGI